MDKRAYSWEKIEQEFNLNHSQLSLIRDVFQQELQKTMRHEASSLNNEPYFLPPPSGNETGIAVTLDLGGTNVRAHLIELQGNGVSNWLRSVRSSWRGQVGESDYLVEPSSAAELYDLQAQTLAALTEGMASDPIPLGYVFSFPVLQTSLNRAILLRWAKEINTPGVEGREVVGLLQEALVRHHLDRRIIPRLVMNDTIGTFMASAYSYPATRIGSVLGTGYNSCYYQPAAAVEFGDGQIINLECGNFDKVPTTYYDEALGEQSSSPASQKLEKMVSGYYLGELLRLMLNDAITPDASGSGGCSNQLSTPHSLDASDVSIVIGDDSAELDKIAEWSQNRLAVHLHYDQRRMLKLLAIMIARRSANLVAATYAAIINHVDPQGAHDQVIAINGSLYEKLPGYKEWLNESLYGLLSETQAHKVTIQSIKEGPALGAAVAVRMLGK
ncbi:MAG: hypothetical protein NTV45_06600 [Firmicutes bacterium]|nr:hypothetical protein [Bacillota bacterium]